MVGVKYFRPLLLVCLLTAGNALGEPLPLWELETSGNRVQIMGSVHYLRASDYPLPAGLVAAYEQADKLVMEIDMDELDPVAAQLLMTNMSVSQSGKSLRELIGADAFNQASALADDIGIPLILFNQFEPWFAALSISQLRMMQLGFDPAWGIETKFSEKAAADGKSIAGLETMEAQLSFMDRLDTDVQRDFLLQSLTDASSVQEEVDSIVSSWRTGDTEQLGILLLEGLDEAPELYEAILLQRNRNWVEPIRALTRQPDNYLVIVGAMHLVGDNSVLSMLEKEGIPSRQLNDPDKPE